MIYKPWIGFTLIGLSIPLDIFLGRTGMVFFFTFIIMWIWSTE